MGGLRRQETQLGFLEEGMMENNAITIPQKEDRLPELRRQISELGSR